MRAVRYWSVRNARPLHLIYDGVQGVLNLLHPIFNLIGYERLDKPVLAVEKVVKGFLFDSKSCGQCVLGSTGMSCPMNCPKTVRNGPCGGVRQDGTCEVDPEMICVWVEAYEGSQKLLDGAEKIQVVQAPVNNQLKNTSAWLREVRNAKGVNEVVSE